jgi:hypothetical protein
VKRGDRVSWTYQGKRTYGVVTSIGGKRATIKSPTGSTIARVGSDDDPIVRIKSESTGNAVIKTRSQLRPAPRKGR